MTTEPDSIPPLGPVSVSSGAPPGAIRSDSIAHNTAMAFLVQILGAAFTAGLTIFLARRLGSGGYGLLSLALGISGLVMLPSDFGVSNSVARFVAEHRGEPARVTAVLADGLRLKFLAALVVSALLAALAQPIASAYDIPALTWPLRGVALALMAQSVMMIGAVFTATGRMDLQLRTAFAESAVEVTASVALVLAGAGATGAAFGHAIGYVVGAVATIALLVRMLGSEIIPRTPRFGADVKRIAGYAGILLIVDGAYTAFSQIDVLIIGGYLGTASVATFSAPMKLTIFLAYPGSAVSSGVGPRLARNPARGPNAEALMTGLRLMFIVQAAITAFVIGWAGLAVQIGLGSAFRGSVPVLRALAPYVFLSGFGAIVSIAVNYLGEARRRVPIAIVTVAVNVVIDLLLVPRIGAIAGAVGTDAAYGVYAPAHLWICQRALGLDLRPAFRTFVRSTAAGAAMTGVLLLFGDSVDELPLTALGAVVGLVVFGIVLWASREVGVGEARELLSGLPARRR